MATCGMSGEPVIKAILYLADELFHLFASVSSIDPSFERCFRVMQQFLSNFGRRITLQRVNQFIMESTRVPGVKEPPPQSSRIAPSILEVDVPSNAGYGL